MTNFQSVILVMVCMALPFAVSAGALSLQVTDEGEPLSMVEVTLVDADTRKVIDNRFTDKKGNYTFSKKQGTFNIRLSKEEYSRKILKNVVLADKPVHTKVEMELSAFSNDPHSVGGAGGLGDGGDDCD